MTFEGMKGKAVRRSFREGDHRRGAGGGDEEKTRGRRFAVVVARSAKASGPAKHQERGREGHQ